jgi:hypothetical protein
VGRRASVCPSCGEQWPSKRGQQNRSALNFALAAIVGVPALFILLLLAMCA